MDLNLLLISRQKGQLQTDLPGLYLADPPRRAARGRRSDRLVLYFEFLGEMLLGAEQQNRILEDLAQTYYKTPGSVTSAMRKVAEALNGQLLDLNLRSSDSGIQGAGLLSIVSLRRDHLYLTLCGPMHAFVLTASGAQHIYDIDSARRALGIGRTTPIYFSQTSLGQNDTILLTSNPPSGWSPTTLGGLQKYDPQQQRDHLLKLTKIDFTAILLKATPGPGNMQMLKPQPTAPESIPVAPPREAARAPTAPVREEVAEPVKSPVESASPGAGTVAAPEYTRSRVEPAPEAAVSSATALRTMDADAVPSAEEPAEASDAGAGPATSHTRERKSSTLAPLFAAMVSIGQSIGIFFNRLSQTIRTWLARLLPDESILTLPSSVMLFFAVAIPLIVVAIATVVYFQRGRTGQFQGYYAQAQQAAGHARNQNDPQARIEAWETVIYYLDQAENYQVTTETQYLRSEAQFVFDELELVTRVNYQSAISGGLPDSMNITRMFATDGDLFLLNATEGNVLRAINTAQGYELDATFQCGPGYPAGRLEPFIDIAVTRESGERHATVMALDASGNLVVCVAGESPRLIPLAPPPTTWGKPRAIEMNLGNLYVLDPESNAVWVYWNGNYGDPPRLFFDEEVPPLENAIDMTVDQDDLYLLQADGRIILCTFSRLGVAPTRCQDPAPYTDTRQGHENQVMVPDPPFTQILATQPPDPSTYLLQPENLAIYHFTLRLLTYQRQYRPQADIETVGVSPGEPATAFALSPDTRVAFLAVGNQVLYAALP